MFTALPGKGRRLCNFSEGSFDLLSFCFACLYELGSCVPRTAICHKVLSHFTQLGLHPLDYRGVFKKLFFSFFPLQNLPDKFGLSHESCLQILVFRGHDNTNHKTSPSNLHIFKSFIKSFHTQNLQVLGNQQELPMSVISMLIMYTLIFQKRMNNTSFSFVKLYWDCIAIC